MTKKSIGITNFCAIEFLHNLGGTRYKINEIHFEGKLAKYVVM